MGPKSARKWTRQSSATVPRVTLTTGDTKKGKGTEISKGLAPWKNVWAARESERKLTDYWVDRAYGRGVAGKKVDSY